MDPMLAEIKGFAGNFAPRGWALCQGQLLAISSFSALFSLIGNTYGGDGRTTFALPDLRGRVPEGTGNGPGLPSALIGSRTGAPTKALNIFELPTHTHAAALKNVTGQITGAATAKMTANSKDGEETTPGDNFLAADANGSGTYNNSNDGAYLNDGAIEVNTDGLSVAINGGTVTVGNTGSSSAFSIKQPTLTINWIIALVGVYPSRS